ncbi:MAG: hypothetical protein FWG38_06710, partial [Defluviitaleaceae bacterium]|nr:hypothetical protein [Defluviitaleaceae bacterium]
MGQTEQMAQTAQEEHLVPEHRAAKVQAVTEGIKLVYLLVRLLAYLPLGYLLAHLLVYLPLGCP